MSFNGLRWVRLSGPTADFPIEVPENVRQPRRTCERGRWPHQYEVLVRPTI